jgi:hypothetical protein
MGSQTFPRFKQGLNSVLIITLNPSCVKNCTKEGIVSIIV